MTPVAQEAGPFAQLRAEFELTQDYPAAALAEAEHPVDRYRSGRADRTDLPFVTIDPPGSMDLDQALCLERNADGFVLYYAIADVAAVVEPGGALDQETIRRGQTFYFPDLSVPLHPRVLSEGSASLLPGQIRPAALWRIATDAQANPVSVHVERALVRSQERFNYQQVQQAADSGQLHPAIAALPEFGALRIQAGTSRGAIDLRLPDQEVVAAGTGSWQLRLAERTSADDWNAQVSLLTGMCAATLMIEAGVGLLRTLPPPTQESLNVIRTAAQSLRVDWPQNLGIGQVLAGLDPNESRAAALMRYATGLLRGADYAAFQGATPQQPQHSGIGAPYAHVTAPLRRLADRFSTEICLAHCAGQPVPQWVLDALPALPETMKRSNSAANKIDRACIDLTEALVLQGHIGAEFKAIVLRAAIDSGGGHADRDAEIFVADPPVIAGCTGEPTEGSEIKAELVAADPAQRTVRFASRR